MSAARSCLAVSFLIISMATLTATADARGPTGEEEPLTGSPRLRLLSATIDDTTGGGNGNLILEPGETFQLRIALANTGNLTARDVFGQIRLLRPLPGVAITDKTALWADIPVNSAASLSEAPHFELAVPAGASCGAILPLILDVTAAGGYAVSFPLELPILQVDDRDLKETVPDMVIAGADDLDHFGASPVLGDFNGDGHSDLLVGTPNAGGLSNLYFWSGEAFLLYGSATPVPDVDLLSPPAGVVRIVDNDTFERFGMDLGAGDVDGDGFDDLMIGAVSGDGEGVSFPTPGEVTLIYGQAALFPGLIDLSSALPPVPLTRIVNGGSFLGQRIVTGDINGDGLADIVISAPRADGPAGARPEAGRVYVLYGDPARFGDTVNLSSPLTRATIIYGPADADKLGEGLAVADLDGDGFDDIVAGSVFADGTGPSRIDSGVVWIVYGAATLLADVDLASPPAGVTRIEPPAPSLFGGEIAAGDVDGDSHMDVLVAAMGANGPGGSRPTAGAVHLMYGPIARGSFIDLRSPPPGAAIFHGRDPGDEVGSLIAMGDLDGNGFEDMALGSYRGRGPGNTRSIGTGEVYVLFGSAVRRGDVDLADPPQDLVVVYGADDDPTLVTSSDQLGWVDSALIRQGAGTIGDWNDDGYPDLILGASGADGPDNTRNGSGETYVIGGRPRRLYAITPEPFAFIDTTTGTPLALGDDGTTRIPIGFPFDYFGETFTEVTVAANGYLSFLDQGFTLNNRCSPDRGLPNHLVAGMWDDLDPSAGGTVRWLLQGAEPSRRLTIEWADVPHFSGGNGVTFEITLFEGTNQIVVQYQDVDFGNTHDAGATAVAGLENRTGLTGASLSCFTPGLVAGTAYRYVPFARPHTGFFSTVETGLANWTPTGLWHPVTEPTCGDSARSPSHSWYYGQNATCTYETGAPNMGTLDSPSISAVPDHASLEFWSRRVTEPFPGFPVDVSAVEVSADGGSFAPIHEVFDVSGSWRREEEIDLGAYAGQDIVLRYRFDTIDDIANNFLGWQVDDIRIRGCRRFGTTGSSLSLAYASADAVCEGGSAVLDGVGSFCASCPGALSYQWLEDGSPISGASGARYVVPGSHSTGSFDFSLVVSCTSDPSCTRVSDPVGVTIAPPPAAVGFSLEVTGSALYAPALLTFTWDDIAGADDYVVVQDPLATGPFSALTGSVPSGAGGLTVPTPSGTLVYFLVAGRSSICGTGPLR